MFHHLVHTKTFPPYHPLIWDRFRLHVISALSILDKKPHFMTINDTLWNEYVEAQNSLWTLDSQVQHRSTTQFGFHSNQTILWDRLMDRVGDYKPFFQEWSDIVADRCKDPQFFSPVLIDSLLSENFQLCCAGGSIVSTLCSNVESSDIDLFVCSAIETYNFVEDCLMLARALRKCVDSKWNENSHFTIDGTVITIVCGSNVPNIQIIGLETKTSSNDVIAGFDMDYTQCKLEMTKSGPHWSATSICLLALCTRQIRYYERSRLSLYRLHKSVKKGFSLLYIPKELSVRMFSEISNKLNSEQISCPHRNEKLDSRKRKAKVDHKDPIFCDTCFLDVLSRWTDVEMFLNIPYPDTIPKDLADASKLLKSVTHKPFLHVFRDAEKLDFVKGNNADMWWDYSSKISRLNEFTYDMFQFFFNWKKRFSRPITMVVPDIWGKMTEVKFIYNLSSAHIVDVNFHNIYGYCKILLRKDHPNENRLLGFLQSISNRYAIWKSEQNVTQDNPLLVMNEDGNTVVNFTLTFMSRFDETLIRSASQADVFLMVDGGADSSENLGLRFCVLQMASKK